MVYVNDLCKASTFFKFVLFADDTNLIASNCHFSTLIDTKNIELSKVDEWFTANDMIINHSKTNVLYFRKQHMPQSHSDVNIYINGKLLNVTNIVNFLGVILDDHLSFDEHRRIICNKVSKSIGVLCKLRPILPEKQLFMLYNSLILPYLNYCTIIWANVSQLKLKPLHILQKKALRICSSSPFRAPSRPIFAQFRTLNIYDIYKLQTAVLMFRKFNGLLPVNISRLFELNTNIHSYHTRSSEKFHYFDANNKHIMSSIRHSGPRIWNSLKPVIATSNKLTCFKVKLKSSLLSEYAS